MNPARAPVAAAFGFPIGPSGIQSAPRPLSAACHILLRPGGVGIETLERAKGIEPSYAAWEAAVLPLNYTRFDNRQYSQKDVSLPVLMWANTS